jgi:hypothetical protein
VVMHLPLYDSVSVTHQPRTAHKCNAASETAVQSRPPLPVGFDHDDDLSLTAVFSSSKKKHYA